jgi:ribosomal protein L40E
MEYHRGADGHIWHFCRNCSHWPTNSFNIIIAERLPPDFEICNECIALNRAGECRKSYFSHRSQQRE